MITPGLHPLCQLLSIYKFEILHHSILGNSDKRRDFDPTVRNPIILLDYGAIIYSRPMTVRVTIYIKGEPKKNESTQKLT